MDNHLVKNITISNLYSLYLGRGNSIVKLRDRIKELEKRLIGRDKVNEAGLSLKRSYIKALEVRIAKQGAQIAVVKKCQRYAVTQHGVYHKNSRGRCMLASDVLAALEKGDG